MILLIQCRSIRCGGLDGAAALPDSRRGEMLEKSGVLMGNANRLPALFEKLAELGAICRADITGCPDGFFAVTRSLADILAARGILDYPDEQGRRLKCGRFFDDWYLYAVCRNEECVYSLFKLREQEYDAREAEPADGDTPGVTVSFIAFTQELLIGCLEDPEDTRRRALSREINRVVAWRGQRHHRLLKDYFRDPRSEGAYLIAKLYVGHIAAFAQNGRVPTPIHYRQLHQQSLGDKASAGTKRLPRFIDSLGPEVCDHDWVYIRDPEHPNEAEGAAILATHTGNVSVHSFAAEVEYHARFLMAIARIPVPFLGRSVYASAIRADMSVDDGEFQGPAPFYRPEAKIVRRQTLLHGEQTPAGMKRCEDACSGSRAAKEI